MRLSSKFFCIAYVFVLVSMGLGGVFIIKNITDTIWNTQIERVNSAANYASDAFLAFADVSYGEISGSRKTEIIRQIKNSSDSVVNDITIYTPENVQKEYVALNDNESCSRFLKKDGLLIMESVCRLGTQEYTYYLAVCADFTEIQKQCEMFFRIYGIVVFAVALISGIILFLLTKKVTAPLNTLTKVTDEIAKGKYGKTVSVKSSDYEINNLSRSFNLMSEAVQQKINDIKSESEKRSMFVADFTHELKTPMTAIMGYAQMLNSYELDSSERKQAAGAIYSEAKRLEKLSLQLLDLYVFKNEKIETEQLRLLDVGEQLKSTLKYSAEKYNVKFTVVFEDVTVSANGVLLLSMLYNLADNAFKASEQNTEVKIYNTSKDEAVSIFVEDKGRGIAEENIKFLTEPFYREDKSRSRKFGGAGLGLSLCKEIAALHGSELCFKSEKGRGTTVWFKLKKGGDHDE